VGKIWITFSRRKKSEVNKNSLKKKVTIKLGRKIILSSPTEFNIQVYLLLAIVYATQFLIDWQLHLFENLKKTSIE
jgi:hypothetical protein